MGGSDRGRPHRGGNRGKNDDRSTVISKHLSFVLRHGAKDLGISMDEKGFVNVAELLSHQRLRSLKVKLPEIQSIVTSSAKQRFEITHVPLPDSSSSSVSTADTGLDNPANYLIRATQGHSIKGLSAEALLTPILLSDADFPAEVVHGTYPASWKLILESGGLKPMGRTHIHFAPGLPDEGIKATAASPAVASEDLLGDVQGPAVNATPDAAPVISGMRASASLLVWVDVRRSIEKADVKWWRSRNGVVLTEGIVKSGEKEGILDLDYISRVVERKSGKIIWKSEWWDEAKV